MLSARWGLAIRVGPHPLRAGFNADSAVILRRMNSPVFVIHGPHAAPSSVVLDSPHSGLALPADFASVCTADELRDGEDCFIDELYLPATARGVPLLAAQFARTYLDLNRHAGDIDLALLNGPWPHAHVPSGKAAIGKALVWRTLDDGRPIYDRKLSVAELLHRIASYHQPYHQALRQLLDAAHARHGVVHHINCHSMNAVSGKVAAGGAGQARADIVLGDRDGSTCAAEFTDFVRHAMLGFGYHVKVNDPFKGVELVRAYSDPAAGRHSLQLEVNKRLYMQPGTLQKSAGFLTLQKHLMSLIESIQQRFNPGTRRA
jgi:N-formylglutamate deformylase